MEDNEIVQLYWDRNQEAISATSRKYGNYCHSIAWNLLGNVQDAEECVNDTYLNAWNAMPPHKPQILGIFLGKITRNLCINLYKSQQAQKRGGGEAALVLEELEECVSGRNNVEQEIDRRELVKTVNGFLGSLSEEKRNIFIRRYWYADSVADIAGYFGMTEAGAAMTLSRIRGRLKKYLLERGYEL